MTRRDLTVFALGAGLALATVATLRSAAPVLPSSAFDWTAMEERKTDVGARREGFRAPTATLDELEYHVTTLDAGKSSHPPHQHPNEEVIIVKEGTVEALVNGRWITLGPGSLIFQASNQPHAVRNAGSSPATYHVLNWQSPGTLEKTAGPAD